MGIYEVLRKDHKEIELLCYQVRQSPEDELRHRRERFEKLVRLLRVHTEAEAQFFYPLLERTEQHREAAREALGEHRDLEERLRDLDSLPQDDPLWIPRFELFVDALGRHIDREEKELFQKARQVLAPDDASPLGDRLQAFEQESLWHEGP